MDPDEFRNWTPEAQAKAAELIEEHRRRDYKPFYCPDKDCNGRPHVDPIGCPNDIYGHWWREHDGKWVCDPEFGCGMVGTPRDKWLFPHARSDQRPPPWKQRWLTWLIASGRGGGKTLSASHLIHRASKRVPQIALVGQTGPALRDTMIEGVTGIMATSPPGELPQWEPSKRKLTFLNGCVAKGFSAEEPDRLRGPQFGLAWADEPAHFDLIEDVWSNLLLGLRLGDPSHIIASTTPVPIKWMRSLEAHERTITTRVSTYANLYNLDPAFREHVVERYEGTRLGRQELHGEILTDIEGALWAADMFSWVAVPDDFERVVVAVDPAGSTSPKADETGIIVLGLSEGEIWVLADATGRMSPDKWGNAAWSLHEKFSADQIVAEKNYGGEMVRHVLDTSTGEQASIKLVDSRRGKRIRAEPVVAWYEKGRIHHDKGLVELEEEQLSWIPGHGASPNRIDALVHGVTALMRGFGPSQIARPSQLRR